MKHVFTFLILVAAALAQSVTATEGQKGTFTATASGSAPLSWQWYFAPTGQGTAQAQPIPGATSPTFVIAAIKQEHAGTYFVRVSNSAGAAQSDNVVFTVALRPPSKPEVQLVAGP
ncbi:immunoglobulin domain-containing protein [Nibricoccus sp. IMCC34717]|uniref:immunoglobulin domain-containing protein n=1 Tax=Nibricoccus sp. IMCC34717 TaxID=3034021 RepID=UPI00384C20E4